MRVPVPHERHRLAPIAARTVRRFFMLMLTRVAIVDYK